MRANHNGHLINNTNAHAREARVSRDHNKSSWHRDADVVLLDSSTNNQEIPRLSSQKVDHLFSLFTKQFQIDHQTDRNSRRSTFLTDFPFNNVPLGEFDGSGSHVSSLSE